MQHGCRTTGMNNLLDYLEMTKNKYSSRTAVDDGQIRLNWQQLVRLSRRIGTALSKRTAPGQPVAVLMEKSAVTLAVMLGTVYAGCFYVMVDPRQPKARIREILRVLEPAVTAADREGERLLNDSGYTGKICLLKDLLLEREDFIRLAAIRRGRAQTDLLYGMFTSGSTGEPKCIVVSHEAVIQFISHFTELFKITAEDRLGNQAPFDFDVSVKDLYSGIMTGAAVILIPGKLFSTPPLLLDYLWEKKVTVLIWAVSALCLVSSMRGLEYLAPESVRKVLFSGEVMPLEQLKRWQKALPGAEFVNLYGPTEVTCNCTYYSVEELPEGADRIPIGRAFPGRMVFLTDEAGNVVTDAGICGEICVAGESLSCGYYRRPLETEKRFCHGTLPDGRKKLFYRTGDLGFYGEDGQLFFSGRKDFQVKHMGHRIELEEIERSMNGLEGVARSCCLMDEKRYRITAFYAGEGEPGYVRGELKKRLPAWMVPGKIFQVDTIPLNKNGKMDRAYFRKKLEE